MVGLRRAELQRGRACFTVSRRFATLICMAHQVRGNASPIHKKTIGEIASKDNRWLKRFRAALAGERGDDRVVGVEGVRLVEAALGSGLPVEAILVSETGQQHLPRIAQVMPGEIPVLRTSDKLFASVADTRTPQGIAALVQPRQATMQNLLPGTALVVVLVGIQDPGNVGTIVRAAEAFGATGAATCPAGGIGIADPFGPKAMRASAGSTLRLPIVSATSSVILLGQLRISRMKVYAAVAAHAAEAVFEKPSEKISRGGSPLFSPWEIDWTIPCAILIGNEGAGLPAEVVRAADARVYIPQAAAIVRVGIESLNAAMAASVLLYEAMRQRRAAPEKQS
jgi:TrmH family RNA methyltransferase